MDIEKISYGSMKRYIWCVKLIKNLILIKPLPVQ